MFNNWKNLLWEKKEYIICCMIGIIPKIFMIMTAAYPVANTWDEVFLFYIPAKLAGIDWPSCMENYRYYGYGFSVFLTPLFKYMDNSIYLYHMVLIIVALLQLIIPIICCYLLKNFFYLKNLLPIVLITTICNYSICVSCTYMYNEHIYIVWIWIVFLLLTKLWQEGNNKKKKFKYSILLGLSFVGALTVHQRAVTLVLTFVILYFFMWFFLKKRIAYIIPIVLIYGTGNFINTRLMQYFVNLLQGSDGIAKKNLTDISNTSVNMSISLRAFQDKDYVVAVIRTILGNLNNWNIYTVGLGVLSLVLSTYFIYLLFKRQIDKEQKKLLYFCIFSILAILITIAGLTNSWSFGIKEAYLSNNASHDSLRGLTYTRYYIAYFHPAILAVLSYVFHYPNDYIKLFRYVVLLSGVLLLYNLKMITPLMKNVESGLGSLQIYTPNTYGVGEMIPEYYVIATFFFIFILFALFFLFRKKKIMALSLICALICWKYIYNAYLGYATIAKENYQYADSSYKIINKLDPDIPIYICPRNIDTTDFFNEVQFLNMKRKLYREVPKEGLKEAIYITPYPQETEKLLEDGYQCFQLDDEEYMYVKGESIVCFVQEHAREE